MNSFFCQQCGERLFFENTFCISCNSSLGFLPDSLQISVLQPRKLPDGSPDTLWDAGDRRYRKCANYLNQNACNWMIVEGETDPFCVSCRLNRIIPDLNEPNHRELWVKMEASKRRLVYTLLKLGLPVLPKSRDAVNGLAFEFLANPPTVVAESERILTGHADGVITINVEEADDATREKIRLNMREVYRTLLGHFRHESAHYYWDLLVRMDPRIDEVRAIFGDERQDYQIALQNYYNSGPAPEWWMSFVTPYASAHPWEDWAETWAHYLHIMDTMETASAGGVEIRLRGEHRALPDPYGLDFPVIRENWHALRFVINSLNRSMGMQDPYPFVLSDAVTGKLEFIHKWVGGLRSAELPPAAPPHVQPLPPNPAPPALQTLKNT